MPIPQQRDFSNPGMQRPDGDGTGCPNAASGLDRHNYVPCKCFNCALRNRSVWVRAVDRFDSPLMDVQARVRYGIESRFGRVEDVNHATAKAGTLNFILRFASEDSISPAITFGGGRIEEKGLKINISPIFRSKWILRQNAFQVGDQPVPHESIYRVVKPPPQRRGELLPFLQDQPMGRGGSHTQRAPSGGPFVYNNQGLGSAEPRTLGQGAPYPGKKSRVPVNTDGSARAQQPFAFNPHAQFHGPPVEAGNYPNASKVQEAISPISKVEQVSKEDSLQSRPVAEEALAEEEGKTTSAALAHDGTESLEKVNPVVSLPGTPVAATSIVPTQSQSRDALDQPLSGAASLPPRTSNPPVKLSKKQRQAAQLRAADAQAADTKAPEPTSVSVSSPSAARATDATEPGKGQERRPSSLFTADEIKDRKQSWSRIAVPLSSPRKTSMAASDTMSSVKPGHDRAKSLPVTKLAPPAKADVADGNAVSKTKEENFSTKPAEYERQGCSDAGQPAAHDQAAASVASSSSPKKSNKAARKKKNKQDAQAKQPAKKEHKL